VNRLKVLWYLYRYFGAGWLAYRLGYALRIRSGWLRHQMPSTSWDDQPLTRFLTDPNLSDPQVYLEWRKSHSPKFFFNPPDRRVYQPYFDQWDRENVLPCREADELSKGIFRYFDHSAVQIGCPPDWHHNPFTGQSLPADRHWSQIDDFSHGDVKVIWDLSRFGFVYALVRAYWRNGDEGYPERFWQLLEDWRVHNPPQLGANWKCGQEISFRVMAWCFGLYGFLDSPATTPERVAMLAQMVAVSGERVEANLRHALSQQNNHGVSEGMGLWTIGLLFPELHSSSRWLRKGQAVLETLGRDLVYDDGAFAQHSANYHRLMLHDYLWAIRLGELNGQPLSKELLDRVKQAGEFLYQVQDESRGCIPCFGHNDGAQVLPLDNCDYQDYRPVIQAIHCLTTETRCYPEGPWDEDLLWLFGTPALKSPVKPLPRQDFQAKQGGYYTLRTKSGFAFTHCAAYRHRPAHADTLNVDIWWLGQNITLDAGTYSYNAPPPWDNPFTYTRIHNTVTVDGCDQMERVGRFLWLPWVNGKAVSWQRSAQGWLAYWEGTHDGYQRLPHPVRVRRGVVQLGDEHWLVLDRLESDREHTYRLQWLFPDLPHRWDEEIGQLELDIPAGKYQITMFAPGKPVFTFVRADEYSPRGWQAPYYYHREPALSMDCTVQAKSLTLWTLFGPDPARIMVEENTGLVESTHWTARLDLVPADPHRLLRSVSWDGEAKDQLVVANC